MRPLHFAAIAALASFVNGQSNQIPGTDAALAITDGIANYGREGSINGLAFGVTVCNVGTVDIDWKAPMDPRHPVYAPILCREIDGRFEQVSGWSWLKHGFSSINANACATCNTTDSRLLGPNCSDTYGSGLNADRFWLGPPEEINPWTGVWNPVGSYFDRGDPDVGAPRNIDGARSLSRTMSDNLPPTAHRVQVDDADLGASGARYYYGFYIVILGEPEAVRGNNTVMREVRVTGQAPGWSFNDVSAPRQGPLLSNWSGASVSSVNDGQDDGRFYLGVKVTGPNAQGLWRYSYALHNRDNTRGAAALRIAKCPNVTVSNLSFHDIDRNPQTDWTAQVTSTEISFLATPNNAVEWNSVYSFSFDANAGPITGNAQIDHARPGPGAMTLALSTQTPGYNFIEPIGAGCGHGDPSLTSYGSPNRPTIPNPSFGMLVQNGPFRAPGVLLAAPASANINLGNQCTLYLDSNSTFTVATFTTATLGNWAIPTPVPSDPALEGLDLWFQSAMLQSGGPLLGVGVLTNGVHIVIGNGGAGGCR
ncbi:MAG: hypothetical protein AB7I19_12840 [Planctomycetota bacterium]